MYVVIRNFEMKQTWISHKAFNELIIQNWTRRPTKTVLLNIGISCRCPLARVEKLTTFGKSWIQHSPEIQQTNYQKCHITKTANGYNIEVIFFPSIGVSHRLPTGIECWRAQRAARAAHALATRRALALSQDSAGGRAVLTAVLEQSRLLAVVDVILFFTTAVIATRYWLETHSRIGALRRRFVSVDSLVVRRLFLQLLSLANVLRAFGLVLDAEF
ncbi:unnamed protein product, partial [Polarella glacialis]